MVPNPVQAPLIVDTPPTPIEPEYSPSGRRSRSRQFLDTLTRHTSRSRSSSASGAHSPTNDSVKHVIATMGLAAGTVGVEHIRPGSAEGAVLEGVQTFMNVIHNMVRRRETGLEEVVEEIKVCPN